MDGFDALDVTRDLLNELQRFGREQPIGRVGLERDDEEARASELFTEPLVVAVDGILLREPRGDVVVDVGNVSARYEQDRGQYDERTGREPPAVDDVRERG